jgi:hypothetical protein
MDRRIGRVLGNWTLVYISVALALILGEAALRLVGFSYPAFWRPDPLSGASLRPGMEGWQSGEGRVYVKINQEGLRDREHELAKPAGTYRIAILGDSYAEAMQVELERTFWSLLPPRLERCGFAGGRRIETVNFGVSGYGTADELLTLRERAWRYDPDMVLLAFFPGNDVRNNSRALEGSSGRAYFVLKDGELALDASFRGDPQFRDSERATAQRAFLQDLRLYQLGRRVRAGNVERHFHSVPIAAALAAGDDRLAEPGLDENVFREPVDPAWREAWEVTDRLVRAAAEESAAHSARFLLVVLSTPGTVYPDAKLRTRYAERLGVKSLFYPEERLQRVGERAGFDVLALAPQMQRRADASGAHFHGFDNTRPGFGHWNEAGHAMAAELIANRLCPR